MTEFHKTKGKKRDLAKFHLFLDAWRAKQTKITKIDLERGAVFLGTGKK
jgi:hypothetical protein